MKHIVWMSPFSRILSGRCFRAFSDRFSASLLASLLLVACVGVPAIADDEAPIDAGVISLESGLAAVEARRAEIAVLESQFAAAEGVTKSILQVRLARAWGDLLTDSLAFTEDVVSQQEAGKDVGRFKDASLEILEGQQLVARKAIELLKKNVPFPADDLPAAEAAAAYTKWFKAIELLDNLLATNIQVIDLAQRMGLDVEIQRADMSAVLENRASNNSILLEVSSGKVAGLKAGVKVLPADTELAAQLQVTENRVTGMAAALQRASALMEKMGLDATRYKAQVLRATGEVTTDILKPAVILGLLSDWWKSALVELKESTPGVLFNLVLFFVIVFIARRLAKIVERLVQHSLKKSQLKLSELLTRMIIAIARNTVMILGVLIALSQVGITLGPLLAGLGVAGFVIGFALQDTLSNFASGMMILIYRPFDVGDLVEAGGVFGTVHRMSLVNSTILTLDNQTIVVPNNKIWGDVIRNVTEQTTRRVDITFGVSYTDDIPKTEEILAEIVNEQALVLKQPEPLIRLHELGDSSVNFVIRVWTKTEDYWDVYWYLMRTVKLRFDQEGISIPFPQRDVHIFTQPPALESTSNAPEPELEQPHVQGRAQITDSDD